MDVVAVELPIESVRPSVLSPRRRIDPLAIERLAERVRAGEMLEPVVVWRPRGEGLGWVLLSGEVRWWAARRAGLTSVRAILRRVRSVREAERLTLIESLRTERLSPVAEAEAYDRLLELDMSQREIASAVYRSAPSVSYALRLLVLPEDVQRLIDAGTLTARHGRALYRFVEWPETVRRLARRVVAEGWSCARLERFRPAGYELVKGREE